MSRDVININTIISGIYFFFQAEDGIRYYKVTGVQTCALPIYALQREKLVEAGSAYRNDPRRRVIVQLRCLAPLPLVPDEHQIRWCMQRAFRAQVVPAEKKHPDGDAAGAGALDDVGLHRAKVDARRDEHHVGSMSGQELLVKAVTRNRRLDQLERFLQPRALQRIERRSGIDGSSGTDFPGEALTGTRAQLRGVAIGGPQEIGRASCRERV